MGRLFLFNKQMLQPHSPHLFGNAVGEGTAGPCLTPALLGRLRQGGKCERALAEGAGGRGERPWGGAGDRGEGLWVRGQGAGVRGPGEGQKAGVRGPGEGQGAGVRGPG